MLTQALKAALSLVEVKVLDHLIVAAAGITSFAECNLLLGFRGRFGVPSGFR